MHHPSPYYVALGAIGFAGRARLPPRQNFDGVAVPDLCTTPPYYVALGAIGFAGRARLRYLTPKGIYLDRVELGLEELSVHREADGLLLLNESMGTDSRYQNSSHRSTSYCS